MKAAIQNPLDPISPRHSAPTAALAAALALAWAADALVVSPASAAPGANSAPNSAMTSAGASEEDLPRQQAGEAGAGAPASPASKAFGAGSPEATETTVKKAKKPRRKAEAGVTRDLRPEGETSATSSGAKQAGRR